MEFRPRVTAETLKAGALIGLHMIAEEATSSRGGSSPELGGFTGLSGPRNPCRKDDETSCCEVYEHDNECRALEVFGCELVQQGGVSLS